MINLQQTPFESELAERAVIGCIMREPQNSIAICIKKSISENTFFNRNIRCIWNAILALYQQGVKCDTVTLTEEVQRTYRDESILFDLDGCEEATFAVKNLQFYIDILKDKETKREVRSILTSNLESLSDFKGTQSLSSLKFELGEIRAEETLKKSKATIVEENRIRFLSAKTEGYSGLPVRWAGLQKMTTGLRPGKVTVIAARPGEGKTTAGTNLVAYLAKKGIPSAIISIEMEENELIDRIIGDEANLDIHEFDAGNFTEKEMKRFDDAAAKVCKWPLYITDMQLNIAQICSYIQDVKREYGVQVVMIDYLQIIPAMVGHATGNRNEEISKYTGAIRNVAKLAGVHIFLISQLNRIGATEEPALHHLRDSGSIEQDAFAVWFIYKDPAVEKEIFHTDIPTIFKIAKNRSGPTGKLSVRFRKHHQKFFEPTISNLPPGPATAPVTKF